MKTLEFPFMFPDGANKALPYFMRLGFRPRVTKNRMGISIVSIETMDETSTESYYARQLANQLLYYGLDGRDLDILLWLIDFETILKCLERLKETN